MISDLILIGLIKYIAERYLIKHHRPDVEPTDKTYIGPQADADVGAMEKNYIGPQADADVGPIILPPSDRC